MVEHWFLVLGIASFAGLLLIVALLLQEKNLPSHRLLAVVLGLALLEKILTAYFRFYVGGAQQLIEERLAYPTSLLICPLGYLYLVTLTTSDFKFQRRSLWHLLPSDGSRSTKRS